jgi:hypothetical protein
LTAAAAQHDTAVRFVKIQPRAYFPTKRSANAAGYNCVPVVPR